MSSTSGYQLVVLTHDEMRVLSLPAKGVVTIGRDASCMVRIDDPAVSRRHAIVHVGETLAVEDLGGSNGTFIRRSAQAGPADDTLHVSFRQLRGGKTFLAVGDCLVFGTACAVVRHLPSTEVPTLEPGVIVCDPAIERLYAEATRVARTNINVLLLGETGVGKEVLARAIHARSLRASGPFMAVNCAALAESLLESELFGSEKGAFTGATNRAGLFEATQGGTVFLDEVGELALGTQAKLLRVLEEREVMRLGSTRTRPIDVRFVSATNRDLETHARNGYFRTDLYFRLSGAALLIPPLRDRPREIEALATSFLVVACRDLERATPLSISPAALGIFRRYSWPGNIRELRNVIERAAVMCSEAAILPEHLPASLLSTTRSDSVQAPAASDTVRTNQSANLRVEKRAFERSRILEALERCEGNQSKAAQQLGMPRRTLVSRLSEFGLTRRRATDGET